MALVRWDTTLNAWVAVTTSTGGATTWDQLAGKPVTFPPIAHSHTFRDLPTNVLGFAVGAGSARPAATMVFWFAASEPAAMIDGDVVLINSVFG